MSIIYRHHQPAFFYRRPPSSAHPVFLGLFLKNMFFLATAWFAASIAIRMVVLTLSILFSPPVFVLLLLTFATSWWSFDALRHDEQSSSFPTTNSDAPFGAGRCGQSPCSRGARQRRREFCHRFQQHCQSKCQQEQSCQKSDNETKPASSTTKDSKSQESTNNTTEERLNNFQQPKQQRVFYQRAPFHIEQDDQHVTLSVDVAGYSFSDLNITVDQDGTLVIAGERKNKMGDAFAFQRQFVLSPKTMDTINVMANVVDRLLIVTIAKKEIPKPRLIAITTEAQETDLDEDDQHVTLSIDVPGYSVSDLRITVDQDGTLDIAGERKNKIGEAFPFQRQFVLSPKIMDTNTITANVVDGLLTITIAKKKIPKPRLITITTPKAQEETDRDETEGPPSDEEDAEEETIVFENAPVEEEDLLQSTKKPIAVETVNDEDEDDEIEKSDPVEGDHDSWEDVIKE